MPPLFAEGTVYAGAGDGRLYAVEAQTGAVLWEIGGFEALEATGAIAGDVLVVGGYSKRVLALNRLTGEELWSFTSGYVVQAAPLLVENQVYIATDHSVYALDLPTGQLLWEAATGETDAFMSGPAYEAGVLYATGGNILLALESATGKEIWRATQEMAFTGLAAANGLIYVGNFDRYLRAYDQHTGEERWKFEAGGVFWSSPAVSGQVVYAGNIDQFLYALNAETGEQLWSFKMAGEAVSEPLVVEDTVYVSDSSHLVPHGPLHLYALDSRTGEVLWTFEVLSTFLPAPTVGEGVIYATSTSQIFALK
jgi:outer membrane protein assembly factor BamB